MLVRRLFDATWDQVYKGVVGYGGSDILADQRVIIMNRDVKRLIWGQLTMMSDEDGTVCLITSHYRIPWLSLIAYLRVLEQAKRLRDVSIVRNIAFEKGLVTCTYSRIDWLQRVVQYSSASSCAQEKQEQQQPASSEVGLGSSPPKM